MPCAGSSMVVQRLTGSLSGRLHQACSSHCSVSQRRLPFSHQQCPSACQRVMLMSKPCIALTLSSKRDVTCCDSNRQTQDHVRQARTTQEETTKVLADLLQAPNTAATARDHIDSINEEFFMVSSTYLDMAKKEGNTEVCRKLEEVLRVAMEEKQKTLRPEIQLLNNLMAATTVPERERVLSQDAAKEALTMNNGYFFGLLDRMISDVKRQPDNRRKEDLMDQLQEINKRTNAQRLTVPTHAQH